MHINCLTSNLYYILRKVAHVQHLLNEEATKTIIQALMLSKIGYCNSIYQGAPMYAINKLQRLQNMGCRIIKKLDKYDHITPHLLELHWFKIKEHIVYKVCVLMYKCIKGLVPQYLSEIVIQVHGNNLRSTTLNNLPTVRCNTAIAQTLHSVLLGKDSAIYYQMTLRLVATLMCLKPGLKPSCLVHHTTYISSFKKQYQPNQLILLKFILYV